MLLKSTLIITFVSICFAVSLTRNKRESYALPDGYEEIIGSIRTSFSCGSSFGYFADVDNACSIFHICLPDEVDDKKTVAQYSFFCPNQTIFNQFSLTCATKEESLPCESAPDFFYLNDKIGKEKELLHNEQDVSKLSSYVSKN